MVQRGSHPVPDPVPPPISLTWKALPAFLKFFLFEAQIKVHHLCDNSVKRNYWLQSEDAASSQPFYYNEVSTRLISTIYRKTENRCCCLHWSIVLVRELSTGRGVGTPAGWQGVCDHTPYEELCPKPLVGFGEGPGLQFYCSRKSACRTLVLSQFGRDEERPRCSRDANRTQVILLSLSANELTLLNPRGDWDSDLQELLEGEK